jgi:hypothetical protein
VIRVRVNYDRHKWSQTESAGSSAGKHAPYECVSQESSQYGVVVGFLGEKSNDLSLATGNRLTDSRCARSNQMGDKGASWIGKNSYC